MTRIHTTLACALCSIGLLVAPACESEQDAESTPAAEQTADNAGEEDKSADDESAAAQDEGDESEAGEPGAQKAEAGQLPDDLPAGQTGSYGGEFEIDDEPMTLASALEAVDSEDGAQTVKVTARVEKVCKKKGCWFTLSDEDIAQPVRVKMKDYGFFVPRNTDGATAIVEGELSRRVVPQKEAQHYADDEVAGTDKEPRKVEGDQEKWEMIITAAQIEMPEGDETVEN